MTSPQATRTICRAALWLTIVCFAARSLANDATGVADPKTLQERAVATLRQALAEQPRWIKVHAAEALLALGWGQDVAAEFANELKLHGDEPQYRIGIWRVLAKASPDEKQRQTYVERIRAAYLDSDGPDRAHAAEALAKLRYPVPPGDAEPFRRLATDSPSNEAPYRAWVVANSGNADDARALAQLLDSPDAEVRATTAYALRFLADALPADVADRIALAAREEASSGGRVALLASAYVTTPNAAAASEFIEPLQQLVQTGSAAEKYEALSALAARGDAAMIPVIEERLNDPDVDVRVAAANALLRIDRRRALPFEWLDWGVLAIYAVGMIAIGVYYERRTKSTEDYLLAGRSMKPWVVGLSYFATLFSTISYLAYPGEMIKHGPMVLAQVLAYPFVFLVGGRLLIPYIMRLRITSAYEILEQRFGLGLRMLGSAFFLLLRMTWMAVIVYATSRTVLVPLLGLSEASTPWVCVALGALTVAYTSMGGLPAVIWTDVAQAFILFFAAIASIAIITWSLGGVAAWWPSQWDPGWDPPKLWFDPTARVTLASAMLSSFTWYVCTAGSDQMAIQRYLATRDAPSAKRMFSISLWSDALVTILLAGLGLAVFAYFRAHPEMLPDGETVVSGADELLPQYIVKGLPVGASGLVMAGLLAAAMSSLASGLNSTCSVVTVDWIDRFRRTKLHGMAHVRAARTISWSLGAVVILCSCFASVMPGNLFEVANKLANLLTAPLFVLFAMAMFIPWATNFGAWVSGIASVATAVGIAHYQVFGLTFLWMMPLSFVVGMSAGLVASMLPIGSRRPMLQASAPSSSDDAKP